jgi:hypothetical protein
MKSVAKTEFGDFQTPPVLARSVCARLVELGVAPRVIVEPTCGVGAFLAAAADAFPRAVLKGFEINSDYLEAARILLAGHAARVELRQADFFAHAWDKELADERELLILGNPPWVTNAAVGAVAGSNLPAKENIYGLRGLAAKTGKANFDIAEWMLIRLLRALRGRRGTIAVLCKFATARKVLGHAWRSDLRVASASLYHIDAQLHFAAAVEACLLCMRLGGNGATEAEVFSDLDARHAHRRIGLAGKDWVADMEAYNELRRFEGLSPYQWRSGVKHDCAGVLELTAASDGRFVNKAGQAVSLEPSSLFPLCKGTDVARKSGRPSRWLLLPQARLGENTAERFKNAPLSLAYLEEHRRFFVARKSTIYGRGGDFAIFGIGDYAFSPWKVAVSALHRPPCFVVVGPSRAQPVLFDDTCYYLSFSSQAEAQCVAEILSSAPSRRFLDALMFPDAKRALTIELLQRLSIAEVAAAAGMEESWRRVYQATDREQGELLLSGFV